jgi:geranylgeranyl pyrophosphate synthase
MYTDSKLKERCQKVLEENGGNIADRASRILLEDPTLRNLRSPLEFISKNWRDPLTPSMMSLSCKAVGGQPKIVSEVALAMNLINLSFYVWDDMVDKSEYKSFKPTLYGKFGEGTALIIGGIASAKAFTILNQIKVEKAKRKKVNKLVWDLWANMSQAETANRKLKRQNSAPSNKKLSIMKLEASDLEICLRIGAILGDGSEDEIFYLGRYGLSLCMILELWKDFLVSTNFTLELAEKIKNAQLPYSILWAREHSKRIQKSLEELAQENVIDPSDVKKFVDDVLAVKTLDNTLKVIQNFTSSAQEDLLKLEMNNTIQTLKFFIEAQSQLFIESVATLQL